MAKKKSKDSITLTVNKKILLGFSSLAGISAVLISKHDPAVILLIIGAVVGFFIGKNLEEVKN